MKKFYLALCCCLLLVNGCGNSTEEKVIEKQIEKETGGKADVDLAKKGMKITGETEGEKYSVTTGEVTEIPKDFPADVYLYQPSKAVQAVEVTGGYSVSLTTPDGVEKVAARYKEQMVSQGWAEQASMNMGGQTILIYEKDGRAANIAVMPLEGETHITVTIGTE
ncbi:MAG: hypothetical protein BM485_02205 [Desulfobulbaceae bacterium DB1]|nr:MAG: hypothetical protein BM485_02205 [Desulfobulbaceae bacterium DB1]